MSIFSFRRRSSQKADANPVVQQEPAKFTLPYLKNMHRKLLENKVVTPENESQVIEILRVIAEMVVYGDSKSELLFDFFCEANMLALFLEIMRSPEGCPTQVLMQILQTLSILCQSVRNTTSMYYLLSNNYINDIIGYPYDFEDDELVDTFISFMKSLSLRLNSQTVQFFFIEETGSYPLLSKAVTFLSFKEPMVRTAAQATILNVYRIAEVRAREYALQDSILQGLLNGITAVLNSLYSSMCDTCLAYKQTQPDVMTLVQISELGTQKNQGPSTPQGALLQHERQLENIMTGFEDWMYYLQDMLDLKIPRLSRALIVCLVDDFVQTTLLHPIELCDPSHNLDDPKFRLASFDLNVTKASLSLFIICQMFRVITSPELHRAIMIAMLHPINRHGRKVRIRAGLRKEKSLLEALLHHGISKSEIMFSQSSDLRMSLESNHPQLLKKKEEQIASLSGRLRSTSSSSSALNMLKIEGQEPSNEDGAPKTPLSPQSSHSGLSMEEVSLLIAANRAGKEDNHVRFGYERFFKEVRISGTQPSGEEPLSGSAAGPLAEVSAEEIRCSILSCLVLQSMCGSLLSLTERERYDDSDGGADDDQLTAAAFYIYSHLFQSMQLWPVLSSAGSLYPPTSLYWKEIEAVPKHAIPAFTEPQNPCVPFDSDLRASNLLEFEVPDVSIEETVVADSLKGVKLNMDVVKNENLDRQHVGSNGHRHPPRTKPSDFDVSLELVFAASETYPNPFTTEPGVSISAGKRLSADGAALRPEEESVDSSTNCKHAFSDSDVPEMCRILASVDWVDPNVVPVPVLDVLFKQQSLENCKWDLDNVPKTIPILLGELLGTERAHQSLPLMELCLSSLCQYCWMTRLAYCSTGASKSSNIAIKYIFDVCADQLQIKAKQLMEFANGDYSDDFLNVFENEVQRAHVQGSKAQRGSSSKQSNNWTSIIQKVSKDAIFLLLRDPVSDYSNYSQWILGDSVTMMAAEKEKVLKGIELLEKMRKCVQIFLLLRSATKRLNMILNQGIEFSVKHGNGSSGNVDDLFCLMVDKYVELLGPMTTWGETPLQDGSTVVMKGRQCVAAFLIRSSGAGSSTSATNSPAAGSRTSYIFSRSSPATTSPATPTAGGVASLYTVPIVRTPERNRKTGDVYFIIDETSIIIASPDKSKLDEVAIIDSADPRDLRVLVQSSTPIPGMNEVSCNAFPSTATSASVFSDVKSNFTASKIGTGLTSPHGGVSGKTLKSNVSNPFCPPIVTTSTWEISIGFETAKNCELVAQHITASRIRVRSTRLDNIRAFLTFWSNKAVFVDQIPT